MILALLMVATLAIRFVTHGTLLGIGQIRIVGERVLLVAFVLWLVLPAASVPLGLGQSVIFPMWIALMLVLLAITLANCQKQQGFRLAAAGVALNLAVIWMNGGMPASADAIRAADPGIGVVGGVVRNVFHTLGTHSTRLLVLGDVLPFPGPQGFRAVCSVGDMLMYIGVLVVIVAVPRQDGARASA